MTPSAPAAPAALLYVEDEENDVFFLRRALQRAGLAVDLAWVGDGDQALAYLSGRAPFEGRERPRLVLLDLNLPLRSGFEVLGWLRDESGLSRPPPVVVFSSSGRPEDRERARQLGASDYLLKPTSSRQFVEVVRQLWDRWLRPANPATVRDADGSGG